MKKKILLVIVLVSVLLGGIFWRSLAVFTADRILTSTLRKEFGGKLLYEKISFLDGAFTLEDIDIIHTKPNPYHFKAKKAVIRPKFNPKRFSFEIDTYLTDPILRFVKEEPFTKRFKKKNASVHLFIENGSMELVDEMQDQVLEVGIASIPGLFEYQIQFSEDSSLTFGMVEEKEERSFTLQTDGVDCEDIFRSVLFLFPEYKNVLQKLEGKMSGFLQYKPLEENFQLFGRCSLSNFIINASDYQLVGKKVHAEVHHPSLEENSDLLAFFLQNRPQNFRFSTDYDDVSLSVDGREIFSSMRGKSFYNPGVGPKIQAEGLSSNKKPFDLVGRGFFHSKRKNWMDVDLRFFSEDEPSSHFLFRAEENDGQIELAADIFHIDEEVIQNVQKVFSFMDPLFDSFSWHEGEINGRAELTMIQNRLQKMVLTNCLCSNVFLESDLFSAKFSSIQGGLALDWKADPIWDSLNLEMEITDGSLQNNWRKQVHISELSNQIHIEDGTLFASHIDCMIDGLKNHIELSGPIQQVSCQSYFKGKVQDVLLLVGRDAPEICQENITGMLSYQREGETAYLGCQVQLDKDAFSSGAYFHNYNVMDALFSENLLSEISHGWAKGEKVALSKYSSFIESLGIEAKGMIDFHAEYGNDQITLSVISEELSVQHPYLHVFWEQKKQISLMYDVSLGYWDMSALLDHASVHLPSYDLTFDSLRGFVEMKENFICFDVNHAVSEEVLFRGKTYFDFRGPLKLDIITEFVKGSGDAISSFASHFDLDLGIDFEGEITSGKEGFYLSTTFSGDTLWGFSAQLQASRIGVTEFCSLRNVSANIAFHSEYDSILLTESLGVLDIQSPLRSVKYRFRMPEFSFELSKGCVFDLRLETDVWDILRLKGNCAFEGNKKIFSFDPLATEFFGTKLEIGTCVIEGFSDIASFEMHPHFSLGTLFPKLQFLLDLGISPVKNLDLTKAIDGNMEGDLDLCVVLSKEHSSISILGKDLSFAGKSFEDIHFRAKAEENGWRVHQFDLDHFHSSFFIDTKKEQLAIHQFSLTYLDTFSADLEVFSNDGGSFSIHVNNLSGNLENMDAIHPDLPIPLKGRVSGKGFLSVQFPRKSLPWQIDADVDLNPGVLYYRDTEFEHKTPVHLSYSTEKGLMIRGLNVNCNSPSLALLDMNIDIDTLTYKDKWLLKKTHFHVPKNFYSVLQNALELNELTRFLRSYVQLENTEILADIGFSTDFSSVWLDIPEARFSIYNEMQHLKNILFTCSPKGCDWQCKFSHQNEFYYTEGAVDFSDKPFGVLTFKEEEEEEQPLTMHWAWEDGGFFFHTIQGYFCGIDACFHEDGDPSRLSGSLKVDFSQISKLLPKKTAEKLKHFGIGDGYEIRGKITLEPKIHFRGILSGKHFELLDYEFKTLLAKLEFTQDHFLMKDFKISDSSGILKIDQIVCTKEEDDWFLSIPTIRMKEFRPSLLLEKGKELQEIEPLVVRNLNIDGFSGNLSDSLSFTGKGHLNFINSFKREHTVFDIPADFLGSIFGLDLELLIPVKGRIEFEITDGVVVLTDLIEAYSENQRSKFFLVEKDEPPYMDFDGNLHVNIKMKQYVLFKFTEHFIITIKGKLMNPEYNLKRKKSFFSS